MTRDPELDRRIADVLAKLATLSEVPAASIGHSSPSSDRERQLPPGIGKVDVQDHADRPPPKDQSAYHFFAYFFARARTDHARRTWLYLAETELHAIQHRAPANEEPRGPIKDRGKYIGEGLVDQEGALARRNQRLLDWYEGMSALEAALAESAHGAHVSEANIRKVRSQDRRDPETGIKRRGWDGWSDEERTKAINRLREQAVTSPTKIAAELGTNERSVRRYIGGYRRASGVR